MNTPYRLYKTKIPEYYDLGEHLRLIDHHAMLRTNSGHSTTDTYMRVPFKIWSAWNNFSDFYQTVLTGEARGPDPDQTIKAATLRLLNWARNDELILISDGENIPDKYKLSDMPGFYLCGGSFRIYEQGESFGNEEVVTTYFKVEPVPEKVDIKEFAKLDPIGLTIRFDQEVPTQEQIEQAQKIIAKWSVFPHLVETLARTDLVAHRAFIMLNNELAKITGEYHRAISRAFEEQRPINVDKWHAELRKSVSTWVKSAIGWDHVYWVNIHHIDMSGNVEIEIAFENAKSNIRVIVKPGVLISKMF